MNNLFACLAGLLKECHSWPEFNIKMAMNGYDVDDDTLELLISAMFHSIDNHRWWSDLLTDNARKILVGACEDVNCKFSDQIIDTILNRTIFDSDWQFKIPDEFHKRILFGAIRKNPAVFKAAYDRHHSQNSTV